MMDTRIVVALAAGWVVGGLLLWIHWLGAIPGFVAVLGGMAATLLVMSVWPR